MLIGLACQGLRAEQADGRAPAAEAGEARRHIAALSSDSYAERAEARSNLLALGRAAIEALESARQSEDTATRHAAMDLLLALRGRGFLGIQLPQGPEDEEADDTKNNSGHPAGVKVMRVIKFDIDANMFNGNTPKGPLPAEAAGILEDDLLLSVNDQPLNCVGDLLREVGVAGPGRVVKVELLRDKQRLVLPVRLTRNFNDPPPPVDLDAEAPAEPARLSKKPARVPEGKQEGKP
jgi:hypothetical protein